MVAIRGFERESPGSPLCRLQWWARRSRLALIGSLFTVSPQRLFLALPWWIWWHLRWNNDGLYLVGLLTQADRNCSCWGQLFPTLQRLSQGRQTEFLPLGRWRVHHMIRSRLCCCLGLNSWLGSLTISGTPWQQKTIERRWFCGYIGHLRNGSSNRLALLYNFTLCHSYQLWHVTLTHINSDI